MAAFQAQLNMLSDQVGAVVNNAAPGRRIGTLICVNQLILSHALIHTRDLQESMMMALE